MECEKGMAPNTVEAFSVLYSLHLICIASKVETLTYIVHVYTTNPKDPAGIRFFVLLVAATVS